MVISFFSKNVGSEYFDFKQHNLTCSNAKIKRKCDPDVAAAHWEFKSKVICQSLWD